MPEALKPLFVTGIGTDVGKTVVAAILTEALEADYWKPVQSGTIQGSDRATVTTLVSNRRTVFHPESYALKEPASPHLAAGLEQVEIRLDAIQLPATTNSHLVIEGAGGLLVPLNNKHYVIDLATAFNAEVVLVVRNYLGCINHTLLSIDYLLQHGYTLKGLILNGHFDPAVRAAILGYKPVTLLGEIDETTQLNPQYIREQAQRFTHLR